MSYFYMQHHFVVSFLLKSKSKIKQEEVGEQGSGSPQLIQAMEFWMELIKFKCGEKTVCVSSTLSGISNLLRS